MATRRTKTTAEATVEPRAVGDDAAAAGMALVASTAPVTGGDDEINLTRDYIAQRMASQAKPTPVNAGGTGATTGTQARANLGAVGGNGMSATAVAQIVQSPSHALGMY